MCTDTSLFNSFDCEYISKVNTKLHFAFIYSHKKVSPLWGLKLDDVKKNLKMLTGHPEEGYFGSEIRRSVTIAVLAA